ncbi:MAG: metal-sulfur cluster assembly factor [Chloroflexi bacterium]|nr:metal-sulfur cluster assembly factor [Chloroflexota bacterium]
MTDEIQTTLTNDSDIQEINAGPTTEQIREVLKAVKDPELNVDIVNLGLIYDIKINPDNSVDIDMTLTSPGCPLGPAIITDAFQTVRKHFPDFDDIRINLVWVPFWNPEMMTEEAKEMLGYF